EQHRLAIDDYVGNTGDYSIVGGHFYCDKAPATSMLVVPVYAIVHAVSRDGRPRGPWIHLGAYLGTLWAVGLPSALAAAVLFRVAVRLGAPAPAAAALTLAWIYGTLALPYATLLYGHQLAAALLVLAFAALL